MEYEYEVGGGIGGGYQFHEAKLASCFRGDEYGISSISFDPQEDLLWAATYEVPTIFTHFACTHINQIMSAFLRVT